MEVTMFRNFTVLSLVLLFSFSLFAQDLQVSPEKISRLKQVVVNNPLASKMLGNGNKISSIKALNPVISHNGYFDSTYEMVPCPRIYYSSALYFVSAAELAAAGITNGQAINEIAWSYYHYPTSTVTGTLKVYLQNTADVTNSKTAATWSTAISTMTLAANNSSFTMSPGMDYPGTALSGFTYTGGGLYIAWDLHCNTIVTKGDYLMNYAAGLNFGGTTMWRSQTVTPPTKLGTLTAARPETYLGTPLYNDAAVLEVYTLGKIPIPYATPHTIEAAIGNNGDDTLYSKVVSLNITGANTKSETVTIDTMLPGYYYVVTFTAWTPTVAGTNTVTVSIPSDNVNTNNSKAVTQLVTYNTYTYSYGPFPPTSDGGVGFNGATGDFVAKFSSSSATSVNQVVVNFDNSGQPFKIGIWDATGAGGSPGTLLWESASLTSTLGVFTVLVNPKVPVNGDFFVGVRQTGTTNVAFSYQAEDPVRSGSYYYTSPTGSTTWDDFAASNSPFRFMIEPRLTLANDVGASTIDNPLGGTYYNLASPVVQFTPKATIANFGSNNQGAFNVTLKILDALDNQVYTSTKSISSLNAGASQQVTFDATSFTPTAQAYTVSCTSSLGTDADNTNDLVSATINYSQFAVNVGAFMEGYSDAGGTAMNFVFPDLTVELHKSSDYSLVESKTGSLSVDGAGTVNTFTSPLNSLSSYYIVLKSSNTIETWSAAPHSFTTGSITYDFTTAATQAFGSNMKLIGSTYCIYSGDENQDGSVDGTDLGDVDNDNNAFVTGVVPTDLNGDGSVDGTDLGLVDNNNNAFIASIIPPGAPASKNTNKVSGK
jgi:hypothetical protein